MRIQINSEHGFHLLCDRCDQVAKADGDSSIWLEWDGDCTQNQDPLIVCASCNRINDARTREFDGTLGQVLLGLLLNAHEPIGQAGRYFVAGHEWFGEGDLASFVSEVSELAQVLDDAGLG